MLLYLGETCGNCTAYIRVTAFWDRAPCSLVEVDRRFIKIERRSTPNRLHGAISRGMHLWNVGLVNETTRRYMPERSHLHTRRRENLKSHTLIQFTSYHFIQELFSHTPRSLKLCMHFSFLISAMPATCPADLMVSRAICSFLSRRAMWNESAPKKL